MVRLSFDLLALISNIVATITPTMITTTAATHPTANPTDKPTGFAVATFCTSTVCAACCPLTVGESFSVGTGHSGSSRDCICTTQPLSTVSETPWRFRVVAIFITQFSRDANCIAPTVPRNVILLVLKQIIAAFANVKLQLQYALTLFSIDWYNALSSEGTCTEEQEHLESRIR